MIDWLAGVVLALLLLLVGVIVLSAILFIVGYGTYTFIVLYKGVRKI